MGRGRGKINIDVCAGTGDGEVLFISCKERGPFKMPLELNFASMKRSFVASLEVFIF